MNRQLLLNIYETKRHWTNQVEIKRNQVNLRYIILTYIRQIEHTCWIKKFFFDSSDDLARELACPNGAPSISPVYAVTAVQNTLYQFLPDINKDVVDRVPDFSTTVSSNPQDNSQEASTTPV